LLAAAGLLFVPATSSAQMFGFGRRGFGYGNSGYSGWNSGYGNAGYNGWNSGYYTGGSPTWTYGSFGYNPYTYSSGGWNAYSSPNYMYSSPNAYSSYSYPSTQYLNSTTPYSGFQGASSEYYSGMAPQGYTGQYSYGAPSMSTGTPQNCAFLNVRLPSENAEVWIEGQKTQQQGTWREYFSPPLNPGKNYTYDVRARWNDNGRNVERTRSVSVQAKGVATVDFVASYRGGSDNRGSDADLDRDGDLNRRDQDTDRPRNRIDDTPGTTTPRGTTIPATPNPRGTSIDRSVPTNPSTVPGSNNPASGPAGTTSPSSGPAGTSGRGATDTNTNNGLDNTRGTPSTPGTTPSTGGPSR